MIAGLGRFFFRYRNAVIPVVFFSLFALSKPRYFWADRQLDYLADSLGLGLAALGQGIRVAVIGLVYIKRGGKKKRVYADHLVQDGIFSHCRNPLYVGNILTALGLIVIHNGIMVYVVGVPFVWLVYWSIVAAEEQYLREKFGEEYDAYCRRVPRFGFRLRGLRQTFSQHRFDWVKVVNKEYGTPFTWITTALALLVWERVANSGALPDPRQLSVLAGIWLCCLTGYIIARVLKKTGRLESIA